MKYRSFQIASKILIILVVSSIISCTKNKTQGESHLKLISKLGEIEPSLEEEACIFDTSTFKFTTEAIRKLDKNLTFRWDKASERAFVKLNNTDSLILHIGGCNHFSFDATFITDSSRFNDNNYLLEKTKWMAQTFFWNGFDKKYVHCLSNKLYERAQSERENFRYYTIIDTDTSATDHIYEGWSFEKIGNKTKINILGYTN